MQTQCANINRGYLLFLSKTKLVSVIVNIVNVYCDLHYKTLIPKTQITLRNNFIKEPLNTSTFKNHLKIADFAVVYTVFLKPAVVISI